MGDRFKYIFEGLLDTVVSGFAFLVGIGDRLSQHSGEDNGRQEDVEGVGPSAARAALEHGERLDQHIVPGSDGHGMQLRTRAQLLDADDDGELSALRARRRRRRRGQEVVGPGGMRGRRQARQPEDDEQL